MNMATTTTTPEQLTCSLCGKVERLRYCEGTVAELKRHQMCFSCNFWREKVEWRRGGEPRAAVIGGCHYMVEPMVTDRTPPSWLGFGGRRWTVRWFDGRVQETNNLWYQGAIPAGHWRELLPDNAEFVEGEMR